MTVPTLFEVDGASPDRSAAMTPVSAAAAPTSQSLYRKYRPQSFDADDLVGQEHVVKTIRNAIRLDRVAHAYLFCGPRGTGKTTTARLLAKAINCLDPDPDRRPCNQCAACIAINDGSTTDIVEIDAASNRGIDDIRDLRERVKFAPSQLRSKFYIVDEAHQITGAAANAFLKTLEEPPAHTRFVLATTDPEELLPTIVSRCQRFDFRRIAFDPMVARLRSVSNQEAIAIDDDALAEIARHATGSLRDALGLLDQLALHHHEAEGAAGPAISAASVQELLGFSRSDRVRSLVDALAKRDPASALRTVNEAVDAGDDPRQLNRQLVAALRDQLHRRAAGQSRDRQAAEDDFNPDLDLVRIAELLGRFSEVDYRIRHSPYAHLPLEVALVESIVSVPHRDALSSQPAPSPEVPRRPTERPGRPDRQVDQPAVEPAPTTRLRDRVRHPTPAPPAQRVEAPSPPVRASTVPPPQPTLSVPTPGAASETRAPIRAGSGALSVAGLADLWPQIRQDVKALNRRVDGLLSSFDPASVTGDRIVLATPYEFHRDKLNTGEVRIIVEQVMSRILNQTVTVQAVLVGEIVPTASIALVPPAAGNEPPAAAMAEEPPVAPAEVIPDEVHDQRLQSAKNIFDAEEAIEP